MATVKFFSIGFVSSQDSAHQKAIFINELRNRSAARIANLYQKISKQ